MANRVLVFDSEPTNGKSEVTLTLTCRLKKNVCVYVYVCLCIYVLIEATQVCFISSHHYMSSKILETSILHQ